MMMASRHQQHYSKSWENEDDDSSFKGIFNLYLATLNNPIRLFEERDFKLSSAKMLRAYGQHVWAQFFCQYYKLICEATLVVVNGLSSAV